MEKPSVKRLSALTKRPLKRHNSSLNRSTSIELEPEIGDDDFERSKRRSIVETNRRNINLPSTSTDSPQINVGDQEVKQHLEICLKMFAENKISVKNAWNLKIIDYLKPMVKSNKFGNNALQVGSTSLDVSTKVYSLRVDDVHSEGLQLASNMARISKTKTVNEDDDHDGEEGGAEEDAIEGSDKAKQKKKKKQRKYTEIKHTIAKDPNTLVNEVPKIESATFQTRSNSDWSVIDNFFTNKLPMDISCCKFMFLNNAKAWESSNDPDETIVSEKKYPYNSENTDKKFEICKEFIKFEVDKWDPDTDELNEESSLLHQSELVFDDKGIPLAELDGSIQDIFHQPDYIYHSSDEEAEECVDQIALRGDVVPVYDLKPIDDDTCMSNDYLYHTNVGNKYLSQIWAGPSHWKLKHLHRNASRFSGQTAEKAVKNTNKRKLKDDPYEPIQFFNNPNCDIDGPNNMKTKLKGSYHPITDISIITLPCNHIMKAPITLLSKPRAYIDRDKMNKVINEEEKEPELKSDDSKLNMSNKELYNEHDYCVPIANDEDEGFEPEVCEEENIVCENQNFGTDNLIDKPETVPESYLPYATKAKKVDMKRLKLKIWQLLTNGPNKDEVQKSKFSDIYEKLPSLLSNAMKEELTSSLAFIALLHLANEQNLKLTGNGNLSDFDIEKDTF